MTTQGGLRWLRHVGAVTLVVALLPVAAVASAWHAIRCGADVTPEELAEMLRGACEGGRLPIDVYWDELECVNLRDPQLEAIRQEALKVVLPLTLDGCARLMELAKQAEALVSQRSA